MCSRRSPTDSSQIDATSVAGRGRKGARSMPVTKTDGRGAGARRHRSLVAAFEAEIGGSLTPAERSLVETAAMLTLRMEQLTASIIKGEPIDDNELIRIAGASRRALTAITARAGTKKPGAQTLQDYIATKYGAADDTDEDDT